MRRRPATLTVPGRGPGGTPRLQGVDDGRQPSSGHGRPAGDEDYRPRSLRSIRGNGESLDNRRGNLLGQPRHTRRSGVVLGGVTDDPRRPGCRGNESLEGRGEQFLAAHPPSHAHGAQPLEHVRGRQIQSRFEPKEDAASPAPAGPVQDRREDCAERSIGAPGRTRSHAEFGVEACHTEGVVHGEPEVVTHRSQGVRGDLVPSGPNAAQAGKKM